MRRLLVLLTLAVLLCLPSFAATYYMATTGSNSNPGTLASPWLTLAYSLPRLAAGDTLFIRGGTYAEAYRTASITMANGSDWNSPITVAGYPGETVTLQPTGANAICYSASAGRQYHIWQDITCDGSDGSDSGAYTGSGNDHIRYLRMIFRDWAQNGAHGYADYIQYMGCSFLTNGSTNQHHGLYHGTDNLLVEDCYATGNSGWGLQITDSRAEYGPDNLICRRNRTTGNGLASGTNGGIVICGKGNNNLFYNNLIYAESEVGFSMQTGKCTNYEFYNNTIADCTGEAVQLVDCGGASTYTFKNNIWYGNTGGNDIYLYGGSPAPTESNNLEGVDPLFVGGGDYHLTAGSPAIDYGTALSDVPDDFDLITRPSLGPYEAGAYEYGTTPPTVFYDTITFDTAVGQQQNGSTTNTKAITVANNPNRILMIGVSCNQAQTCSGVTVGGAAATAVANADPGGGKRAYLYYYVAPAVGSNTVVATFSAATQSGLAICSYYNTLQVSPVGTAATHAGGATPFDAIIEIAAGQIGVDVIGIAEDSTSETCDATVPQTQRIAVTTEDIAMSDTVTTGTVTMKWTTVNDYYGGQVAVPLKPSVTPGGTKTTAVDAPYLAGPASRGGRRLIITR